MSSANRFRLPVHVQPRASKTEIVGSYGDGIKVRLAAPPVDGAANQALIDLLAESLRVPRRSIRIVQGASGRRKVVEVEDGDPCSYRLRLEALLRSVDKGRPRR